MGIQKKTRKTLMVFAGRVNSELSHEVARILGTKPVPTQVFDFANGEIFVRYQDKKHRGREPISARLMADLFKTAGADRLMAVDLHTDQIQGFFDGPVDHLMALPTLCDYVGKKYGAQSLAVVSPDAGRIKVAEQWSRRLGNAPLAFIHKTRDITRPNEAIANRVVGDVAGRLCILVDDMIDPAIERLTSSSVTEVIVTNTLPIAEDKYFEKLTVLSIGPLIAEAVRAVFEDGSVTSLFGGKA